MVSRIAHNRDQIIIPTPVLSEVLVKISPEQITDLLTELNGSVWIRLEAFDAAATVELGRRTAVAIAQGDKREGLNDAPWTKVKFDRQIVAIAIVAQATEIISDDPHVKSDCDRNTEGMQDLGGSGSFGSGNKPALCVSNRLMDGWLRSTRIGK